MTHTINDSGSRSPMWLFEENFRLLQRLLPEVHPGGERYCLSAEQGYEVSIQILERCPYTTMLALSMPFSIDGEWLPQLSLQLRISHDARVVEVSAYQGCERIPPRYQVTTYGRHLRDDKRQINRLLHDLLRYCLRQGYRELQLQT